MGRFFNAKPSRYETRRARFDLIEDIFYDRCVTGD